MNRLLLCLSATLCFLATALADEPILSAEGSAQTPTCFLIGNSLTWDTVPARLDGNPKWHVDCGKSLPYIVANPAEPCVKTSTLWPAALKDASYDALVIQVHYGATLQEDADAITSLIQLQPKARVIIHTGWARSAQRSEEWTNTERSPTASMQHCTAYVDALLDTLRKQHPDRSIDRTRAMDLLQQIESDIKAGESAIATVSELYRDAIHMNVVTGRYLMHNAMRAALGQPKSIAGFEKLMPEQRAYFDSVLDRVHASQ